MANARQDSITRACKCLNIRIQSWKPQNTPPDFLKDSAAVDSDYSLMYVGHDGLCVGHPQVTMRTRKMGHPLGNTNRCIRYTTLTCLLCQTLAYRVQHLVPLDVEGQEGPLLPTYDWVEQDILMSGCGWIEVHNNCLDSDTVSKLLSSLTYSSIFNVAVLPGVFSASAPSAQPSNVASADTSHAQMPSEPILSHMRPLFPPAPFIPSHPVFTHFSSIATSQSHALRSSIEAQFSALLRDKVAEIERAEAELKTVVETLWKGFLESLCQTEKVWGASDVAKSTDSTRGPNINDASGQVVTPAVSVRDFVPVASPTRMVSPALSVPRVSSLSASLSTSTFHHPRAFREQSTHTVEASDIPRSPPPYSSHPSSVGSVDSRSLSSSTSSDELLALAKGESLIQPFKRSMDEARDTAASFRYFIDMEAEMEMMRGLSPSKTNSAVKEVALKATEVTKPTNPSSSARAPENEEKPKGTKEDRVEKSDHNMDGSGLRGKRKVTFDIKPDTLTSDGPDAKKNGNVEGRDAQDMLFDLDGQGSDCDSSDAAPVLPFKEMPHIPRRRGRPRNSTSHGGLPTSLSTLRPTSLPPYASLQGQSAKQQPTFRTQTSPPEQLQTERIRHPTKPEASDAQEEEILKLVAADTPSHRGAWKPNSRAWQLFVSRQGGKNGAAGALIPEEAEVGSTDTDESDDMTGTRYHPPGIPSSLPISIEPLSHKREPLSLGSYQPKTSISHCGAMGRMVDRRSTSALRKASYAARDRDRSMDPGALDFVSQDDEGNEEDESDDEPLRTSSPDEARGRRRALKIIEARNNIPAAGMWRSLA